MTRPKLILGSGSPRRAELLGQLGLRADAVRPPDVDETPLKGELPLNYCRRIAGAKADAMDVATDEVVLCADTTVALGRRIMGKPRNEAEAAAFLRALAGRRHKVITSVVVRNATGRWARDVVTAVKMKRLSDQELAAYLASGDWQGKAGGYAIQGPAGAFVSWIEGSYTSVVGLPVHETANLLIAAGFPLYDI
ncbi:Maf-like protein YhdE [Aliiroseovarius sp. xm-m-379]|uniref:Maf family protein n=1 Tax=unclassified Aliiroseovarius TaxID=2623558 RepID=UPI001568A5C2|nr:MULTISPECIES: Maf family protein [unclassified Aliiroseovarius]NRP12611.1 Maf-like protein YhdE [Aliiroseovarius sp. xm-d-517]NRP24556.1 Maf-like protein YhdE [Aliiroseovarius sp. xm-m-379]NRP29634.1 Maf-like protein YhdE [Aliiroseovarius sp. xm-m-314]NRP33355.1 Maf-like protein YhdE [Aliiroseovarius sp. xm-a-104]NRP39644.1 Maf-like protein YhdE [Aliiroseovarius sp. xm-m-339-2]